MGLMREVIIRLTCTGLYACERVLAEQFRAHGLTLTSANY